MPLPALVGFDEGRMSFCLVQRHHVPPVGTNLALLPADDGVSIPGEYTSFLAPISSSKLYNEVRACREKDRDPEVN